MPCEWAGLDVIAHVGADDVDIVGPDRTVHHARKRFGERSVDYRHYVRELAKKPQAVRQVAAELTRDLGPHFVDAWRSLVDAHGPKQGARIFAKVLSYVETRGIDSVATTLASAIKGNESLLMALAPAPAVAAQVADDTLPVNLRSVQIESGCAADYDALLGGGTK